MVESWCNDSDIFQDFDENDGSDTDSNLLKKVDLFLSNYHKKIFFPFYFSSILFNPVPAQKLVQIFFDTLVPPPDAYI
jgi:hypothetical protein